MNNCNTRSHVGPLSLSLISEGGASPGVLYPHKMSDPGIHAIEGPALVISHSARKVVGGATPLVNNSIYRYMRQSAFSMCLLHLGLLSPKEILDTALIARNGYITSTGFSDRIFPAQSVCCRPINPNAGRKTTSSI